MGKLVSCLVLASACSVDDGSVGLQSLALVSVPRVFNEPFFQSPVRGDPDQLLLIAGANLVAGSTVYYERASVSGEPVAWEPPTADSGVAPVVSETALPHNVVVRLPAVMIADEEYSLWVRAPSGSVSERVYVNDARPLWFSPSVISRSGTIGTLPRELKVVGRNLRPAPGAQTEVRLVGLGSAGTSYTMTAANDGNAQTSIEDHVARVALPMIEPGTYRVDVSRDGSRWVAVSGASLVVTPDPPARCTVSLASTSCSPNDDGNDRDCFASAIASAAATGCDVAIPAGTWLLDEPGDLDCTIGLLVPAGVGFVGVGTERPRVLRGDEWTCPVVFTLLGRNEIRGIHFDDAYFVDRDTRAAMFQLGKRPSDTPPFEPQEIEDIAFWDNRFDGTHESIGGGGLPLRRIYIVGNVLHAYRDSIFLDAFYLPREPDAPRFRLEDSIVARNLFLPGDFVDPDELNGQGAIAAQFGAALRVDVSENVADGRYPAEDSGWRAGFFFHQTNSHEELLISQNELSCTSDKAGDGEAIAFDFNYNTYAFSVTRDVRSAGPSFVRVRGSLAHPHGDFTDHWIQVVRGGGVGQSRRIVSHRLVGGFDYEIVVDPPWDAVPAVGSGVLVSKSFWQTYVLDNSIDTRGCTRTNANGRLRAGEITLWAQTSDSVVAGNAQYESDGIVLYGGMHSRGAPTPAPLRAHNQYFVDVRNNRMLDEYDYRRHVPVLVGSYSGVALRHWTLGGVDEGFVHYANTISHNTVWHADGAPGGGISLAQAFWHFETPAYPQISSTIVQRNHIENIRHVPGEDPGQRRVGLVVGDLLVRDTVLFANEIVDCEDADIVDDGFETTEL